MDLRIHWRTKECAKNNSATRNHEIDEKCLVGEKNLKEKLDNEIKEIYA